MKNRGIFLATCLLVGNLALAGDLELTKPERVGMSSERLQNLRAELQRLVEDKKSAGIQIIVSRRGRVVMHENFGVADISNGDTISNDTLFRIFSMTKPIVATAMMVLYEEGAYSLQDPIAKHIPELADLRVFAGVDDNGEVLLREPARPPTIHDLFQHSAGFTYGIFGDSPVDKLYREANVLDSNSTLDDFIGKLAILPLLFDPGTQYNYSIASDIQGYLIRVLSGQDPESFIRERVLGPLKMDETVSWVPPAKASLLTKIHTHNDAGNLDVFADAPDATPFTQLAYREPTAFSGGGQLISTGDDYWRFAQMLLNGGELDGNRILSPMTVRLMTSNRLPESIPGRSIEPGWGYGFNLSVVSDPTLTNFPTSKGVFRHGGLASTVFSVDPEQQLVIIYLTQYLPNRNQKMYDLMHRFVHAAIVD